ncbi:hypothetical protein CRM22_010822 [Opisthorchis felineus]|uniref:Uncharacterized protein n=1 Tax=Opisthorchis felineus TaxID=147828 RepID=A0A4S2KR22_OPIFE|nr:hypothetical protein CRM22_010822 [Opisthorchis felineus]
MMPAVMRLQCPRLCVSFTAQLTNKWMFLCVHNGVSFQLTWVQKTLLAQLTRIIQWNGPFGFFGMIHDFMFLQRMAVLVLVATSIAQVGDTGTVGDHVAFEI